MKTINNTTQTKEATMRCYGQVNQGRWCQEHYETASRHAGKRANQLRKAGFAVVVCALGMQVTPVGYVRMTMVDIRPGTHQDTCDLPQDGWTLERI